MLSSSSSAHNPVSNQGISGDRGKIMLSALNVPSQELPLSGQGDVNENSLSNSDRYIDDSKWMFRTKCLLGD